MVVVEKCNRNEFFIKREEIWVEENYFSCSINENSAENSCPFRKDVSGKGKPHESLQIRDENHFFTFISFPSLHFSEREFSSCSCPFLKAERKLREAKPKCIGRNFIDRLPAFLVLVLYVLHFITTKTRVVEISF